MLKYAEIIVKVEKKRIQSLNTLYTGPADGFSYGQSFELCRGRTEQRSGLRYVATHGPICMTLRKNLHGRDFPRSLPDLLSIRPLCLRSSTKIPSLYIHPIQLDYL